MHPWYWWCILLSTHCSHSKRRNLALQVYNNNNNNLWTVELEGTLWIIESSPFQRGTVGNWTPSIWIHSQRLKPLSYPAVQQQSLTPLLGTGVFLSYFALICSRACMDLSPALICAKLFTLSVGVIWWHVLMGTFLLLGCYLSMPPGFSCLVFLGNQLLLHSAPTPPPTQCCHFCIIAQKWKTKTKKSTLETVAAVSYTHLTLPTKA